MSQTKKIFGLLTICLCLPHSVSFALPVDAQAKIIIGTSISAPGGHHRKDNIQRSGVVSATTNVQNGSDFAIGQADLSTGKLKTKASSLIGLQAYSTAQAFATLNDFLTFDRDGTASFSALLDGILSISDAKSNAFADMSVRFFDVTDQVENVYDSSGAYLSSATVENEVTGYRVAGEVYGLENRSLIKGIEEYIPDYYDQRYIEQFAGSGLANISLSLEGILNFQKNHTYAVEIFARSTVERNAVSDFFNTATFNFTDLGGASFTSQSASFLSNAPGAASVPEPLPLSLLLFSLVSFAITRGKRMKVTD